MKKRKYIVLLLLMVLTTAKMSGQYLPKNSVKYDKKRWHFGFTLGLNTMNFNLFPVDHKKYDSTVIVIQPSFSTGFNIGIVANMNIVKYLDLRFVPTLSFGQRNMNYLIKYNIGEEVQVQKSVESTFLDFPFTLKYKSKRFEKNLNNIRTYVLMGARYSIDLASQKKKKGTSDEIVLKLNPHDFMVTAGVGFDFFLPYFKLGIEFQMAYGFLNVLDKEKTIFTTNIDRLTSRMGWITLTFE